MIKNLLNFCGISMATWVAMAGASMAAQAPNPRSGVATPTVSVATSGTTSPRDGRDVQRLSATTATSTPSTTVQRSAVSRNAAAPTTSARATARQTVVSAAPRPDVTTARSATNLSRSATAATTARAGTVVSAGTSNVSRAASASHVVRSAATPSSARGAGTSNVSRAASSRATAVFDDVSKIGGGYAACRESYNTCMDQFCAKANETYRRCFCSERFTEFRDKEAGLDEAKTLLMRFQDNNLNAVDKTAAEVTAMYTATAGEQAIKDDVSGASAMLSDISDLLSGKRKAGSTGGSQSLLDKVFDPGSLDFSVSMEDAWAGTNTTNDIFSNRSAASDLSTMEGAALYKAAHDQCTQLIREACTSDAVTNMARSSYSILISQDCNAYEKKITQQEEAVTSTVRQAEKYLREARLEEYRTHNSADVNECLTRVKDAIQGDMVCGSNYKRCLDPTGLYVNATTGEAIYTPMLFKLPEQINLYQAANSNRDILDVNRDFNKFLDDKRQFAATALDSCRDMADTVWTEFKRTAIIEISQAQDELIEDVKSTCVSTMAECYDSTTNSLKEFDTTTSQMSGALGVYAAKDMCKEKVVACAALYGGNGAQQCQFDNNGKIKETSLESCGLKSLLAFVSAVDTVKIQE
ncbi:hypothetical protein HDR63_04065, partial [bacterium]|nr:hypothetical protein [bacterium]